MLYTYRGSGVLNLAHGSMALYPTYVFAELRDTGDLVLPGVPGSVHLGDIGLVPCLAVALVVAALIGAFVHIAIFRPLRMRGATPLATIVVAVGLHMVLETLVVLRFDATPRLTPTVLPTNTIAIGGAYVPVDRIYLAVLVTCVAVATSVVQQRTRFGLASRAMAQNPTATALLGYSPDHIGARNWMIGSMLAALFGILLAPMTGLAPRSFSFLLVPALATVLAGGFVSTSVTVGVGLALGIVQTQLTRVHVAVGWLGPQTLREVVPFVALAIVLAWRGAPLPLRGASDQLRLPRADLPAHPWRLLAGLAAGGALAVLATQSSYRDAVVATLIGAVVCLSLVVLTGFAGQISLAQLSFAGVSGFSLSRLSAELHVPFPIAPLLAATGAAACAVIVGLPALRARGASFAVMTLGGALAVNELVFRNLSNGVLKANLVPPPRLPGVDLAPTAGDGTPRAAFGLFVLAVVATCAAGVIALRRSLLGRQLLAVRANERAAAAAGANVALVKLSAFALSGFLAGIAGALTAYHEGVISVASYGLSSSFLIFCAAYLGGIGSVAGAFIGGTIGTGAVASLVLDRALHIADYQALLSGLAVIGIAVTKPQGIARSRTR